MKQHARTVVTLGILAVAAWVLVEFLRDEERSSGGPLAWRSPEQSVESTRDIDLGPSAVRMNRESLAAPMRSVSVVVESRGSGPVPEAKIRVGRSDPGASGQFALTDSDGRAQLGVGLTADGPWTVRVTHEAHMPEVLELQDLPDTCVVELTPSDAIAGSVLDEWGRSAGEGVAVVCKRRSDPWPDPESIAVALTGQAIEGLWTARTDAQGRYCLQGVEPGASYDLHAGSNGAACYPGPEPVSAPSKECDLSLRTWFAAFVRLVSADNDLLVVSPTLSSDRFSASFGTDVEGASSFMRDDVGFCLAGGDLTLLRGRPWTELLHFVGPPGASRIGPCFARYRLPGYADASTEFHALPMQLGIEETTLPLIPVTDEWTALEIATVSDGALPSTCGSGEIEGLLRLTSGSRQDLYPVILKVGSSTLLESIPRGAFHVSFRAKHLPLELQPAGVADGVIQVEEGRETLVFDLGSLASIEFMIRGLDDEPKGGPLRILIVAGTPTVVGERVQFRGARTLVLPTPPYCVTLPAGTYSYRVLSPVVEERTHTVVELAPGQIERVALVVQ